MTKAFCEYIKPLLSVLQECVYVYTNIFIVDRVEGRFWIFIQVVNEIGIDPSFSVFGSLGIQSSLIQL